MGQRLLLTLAGLQVFGCAVPEQAMASQDAAAASQSEAAVGKVVDLCPVTIVFEPALISSGTLIVRHESGWQCEVVAPPSGVALHMPEGPANLLLRVGERRFEHSIRVVAATGAEVATHVWHVSPK